MKKLLLLPLFLGLILGLNVGTIAQKQSRSKEKALERMVKGDFNGAISVLDKAIADNEDLFEAHKLRGTIRRMTGDLKGALADFDRAIEIKGDDGLLYEQRAQLRLFQGYQPAQILQDLDAAISYGRKHEKVYNSRGMIRRMLGDDAGALEDYEVAIGLRPDFAGAYLGMAGIYTFGRDYDRAIEVLERYLHIFENSGSRPAKTEEKIVASTSNLIPLPSADKSVIGETAIILADAPRAQRPGQVSPEEGEQRAFETEQRRNTAAAYGALGDLYRKRKDYEKAVELMEKGLRIDPTSFSTRAQRGELRSEMGDYEGAISDFDEVAKYMQSLPPIYLERGIAHMMVGKQAEAQKDFNKFLELAPNGKAMLEKRITEAKAKLSQDQE